MYYVIKRNGDEMAEQVRFKTFSDAMDFYTTWIFLLRTIMTKL